MTTDGAIELDLDDLLQRFNTAERQTKAHLRKRIREATEPIAQDARSNASWSTRIPGAIRVSTSFGRKPGTTIRVSSAKAPHARPFEHVSGSGSSPSLENMNNAGYFRHPVFADNEHETRDQWTWVRQDARPFLLPAMQQNVDRVRAATRQAVIDAAHEAGFM